ncbi:MAG: hypothetical protein A2Y10_12270 [Planctomycetes bacterium GWF2_41_51]|nr:MAG: hypothetical protein A2Y10_12270 [Planctomycetes bacterium GWF2_41_51]HBG28720.1 hypothetical protein [Phycisphaerales bacterium]
MQDNNTIFEIDPELLAGFIDEAREGLTTLDNLFIQLETEPANIETIDAIFRPIHTIKGNSAFFGLMKLKRLAHEMETLLTLAKEGKLFLNKTVINVLLAGVDQLKEILARARDGKDEITDETQFDVLVQKIIASRENKTDTIELWDELFCKFEKFKRDFVNIDASYIKQLDDVIEIAEHLKKGNTSGEKQFSKITEPSDNNKTEVKSASAKVKSPQETNKTMRVAEETIDNFLGYVGELIVIGKMYDYLQKNIEDKKSRSFVKDFKRVNETFESLSENLQKSIMEIRKVPVRTILQKAPRMVHDIAIAAGKEIKVELIGQEIEIDKRLVEILDAPLIHMVRNSADHGIETPAERLSAGKEKQATVRIAVSENKSDITLSISDDGKGINLEAIKAKGVKLGLVRDDQKLTEEQITDLLFVSGVSTAEKITEVSGRGVGMDVVKRNIESVNGKITINTKQGQGTEIIIRLPKTVSTQIIDGFLVNVSGNCFIIPMDKVMEVFRPDAKDISSVKEKSQCVLRHNELLPIVKLSDIFGQNHESKCQDGKILVSTNILKKRVAFCVDEAMGVQKVVLKDFGNLELKSQFYTAAAVMGNGSVAMILDVDKIAGFAVTE